MGQSFILVCYFMPSLRRDGSPGIPRGHPHLLLEDLHKMLHILISDLSGDLIDAPVVVQKSLLCMLDTERGEIFGKPYPFHLGKQLGEIGGGEIHQGGSRIQRDALGVIFLKILLDLLDEQDLAPAGLSVLMKSRELWSGSSGRAGSAGPRA